MERMVQVAGRDFVIRPVKVGQLPRFIAACEPVARELARGDLLGALARQAENVIDAVSIGAGCEREWLDEQDMDVLVELGAAVMEVNGDFFASRLVPAIEKAASGLSGILVPGGEAGSSTSSEPGSVTAM